MSGSIAVEKDADVDFDALVNDIIENPELLNDEKITPEQILEIQKRINPYVGINAGNANPEEKHAAIASYTNLRSDYLERFLTTSLTAFVFQMCEEYEVPRGQRVWVPKKSHIDASRTAPADPAALAAELEAAATAARLAADSAAAVVSLKQRSGEADLVAPGTPETLALLAEYAAEKEKAAGLLYAATVAAHRVGQNAEPRLRATAEAGREFPSVREIVDRMPLPPPPSQVEMPPAIAKNIVLQFLREYLHFDPSVHVRSGHSAEGGAKLSAAVAAALAASSSGSLPVAVDEGDEKRMPLATLAEMARLKSAARRAALPADQAQALEVILESPRARAAVLRLLDDETLQDAAFVAFANSAVFRPLLVVESPAAAAATAVIPPQDTFHRFRYYTEVNYEELRAVTESIYPEKPDLDWMVALWADLKGTPDKVAADFEKWCQRHGDEVPSSVKLVEYGAWTVLGDFKENRKNIQFYNKNTEVLKRILDRHAEDKKIGAELMKNRVRKAKAANIAEAGPDAEGLAQYRTTQSSTGHDLAGKGAQRVLSAEEMKRLEAARGDLKAAHELEAIDQYRSIIAKYSELEKTRELTTTEKYEYDTAKSQIDRAQQMIEVPDDAIQVDVFTTNAATGEFGRGMFYTKAVAPDDPNGAGPAEAGPADK